MPFGRVVVHSGVSPPPWGGGGSSLGGRPLPVFFGSQATTSGARVTEKRITVALQFGSRSVQCAFNGVVRVRHRLYLTCQSRDRLPVVGVDFVFSRLWVMEAWVFLDVSVIGVVVYLPTLGGVNPLRVMGVGCPSAGWWSIPA